jgi:hypothetical protein
MTQFEDMPIKDFEKKIKQMTKGGMGAENDMQAS